MRNLQVAEIMPENKIDARALLSADSIGQPMGVLSTAPPVEPGLCYSLGLMITTRLL